MMNIDKIKQIYSESSLSFEKSTSLEDLYQNKVKYLGKTGVFSLLMRELSKAPKEERPGLGKLINEHKKLLEVAYAEAEQNFKKELLNKKIANEQIDITLPGIKNNSPSIHPVNKVIGEIVEILSKIGFSVRQGPYIESDWYNFGALNIPEAHPARDMQDTFYISDKHVLRTHTSPVQIRTMESEDVPIRILSPGATFRFDSDSSHSPQFHQIEGLLIDKSVSMADLKGTISFFIKEFFSKNIKVRFRPSFFPFTEPSAEIDCECPGCNSKGCSLCGYGGWLEVGGCGLVHPNVLKNSKVKDGYEGFAFGFGIERMAMIKYGVDDIRLYSENNIKFLRQFKV